MAKKTSPSGPKNHHTVLFKKILTSFFSKEAMMQIGINPASMFVSFVSSKQFFGLINRRMAEHYKLNLFDINLDPFDIKIGFGDDQTMTTKNIDIYYAYNSSANFLGYKNYSPNMIATALAMFFAAQTVDLFEDQPTIYFNHFIYTIYFLVFLVIAKIKVFPEGTKQEQFDRFSQVFWNFYKVVFANTKENLSQEKLKTIQTLLTANAHIMFAIYHSILHLSNYFPLNESDKNIDVIMRVLAGDIQHKTNTTISKKYIELYESLSKSPAISPVEKKIIDLIIPADIILRYLLNKNESKVISKHILTTIYPVESHSELLESFVQDGENAPQIIEEALKFSRLKNFFFLGLHHYIKAKLQDISASRTDISQLFEDEFGDGLDESIDEFLSYLAESDFDSHETGRSQHTTPKNVQIQSITFDKLINFYISYIGGFRISRGDTGYLRIHKPTLLQQLVSSSGLDNLDQETLAYYKDYMSRYEKNSFYYQYVFNHIRSGKNSFILPARSARINHNFNGFIIKLLNESYRSILLQDINESDIKLLIKNSDILDLFKTYFEEDIASILKLDNTAIIDRFYKAYSIVGFDKQTITTFENTITDQEISRLKNRLYSLDFWIYDRCIVLLINNNIEALLNPTLLIGLFASLKETLYGFLLYLSYIKHSEEAHQKDYHSKQLITQYIKHILMANSSDLSSLLQQTIIDISQEYHEILHLWTLLDDNQDYMYIGFNNWTNRIEQSEVAIDSLSPNTDDILWFHGFLKTISYYNRRLLIPEH